MDFCFEHTASHAKTHPLNALFSGVSSISGKSRESHRLVYLHYPPLSYPRSAISRITGDEAPDREAYIGAQ